MTTYTETKTQHKADTGKPMADNPELQALCKVMDRKLERIISKQNTFARDSRFDAE